MYDQDSEILGRLNNSLCEEFNIQDNEILRNGLIITKHFHMISNMILYNLGK